MICALRQSGPQAHRSGLPLRFVRSPDWLKMKNSDAPAVKRKAEWNDDWWSCQRLTARAHAEHEAVKRKFSDLLPHQRVAAIRHQAVVELLEPRIRLRQIRIDFGRGMVARFHGI